MHHQLPRKSLGVLLVVVFSLIGCTEWTYHRLNDPSRIFGRNRKESLKSCPSREDRGLQTGSRRRLFYLASGQGGRG